MEGYFGWGLQRSASKFVKAWLSPCLMFVYINFTSGCSWPSDTVRCERNVPAPSLLELQRERRETTELRYPGRCRRQPRKHTGPVPVHLWQRAWFMARDLGFRGETGLRHRLGLIFTPAVPHTWAPPGPGQVFLSFGFLKPERWDLGPGLVGTEDSGLGK